MKLNICISNQDIIMDDYLNLTYTQVDNKNCIQGNFKNLDSICDDNECMEIIAPSVLNFVHNSELSDFLQTYRKKLRIGGIIKIGGTSASHAILESCDMGKFNNILYTDQINKSGIYTPSFIVECLKKIELSITRKSILENNMFIVEAVRNV